VSERILAVVGGIFLGCSALVILLYGGLRAAIWLSEHFPRFHLGAPKNRGELSFFSLQQIITKKDGSPVENPEPLVVQQHRLAWWSGMSSRSKARWWFGLMIFEEPRP
jgi:hypothetical protein